MKPELFIQRIGSQGRVIYTVDDFDSPRYRVLRLRMTELKKLTRNINFGCEFENNQCFRMRQNSSDPSCYCCEHCNGGMGYLRIIWKEDFNDIANFFSGETGFWRKDVGCLLPRKLRSLICITHHCRYHNKLNMHQFYEVLREYEEELIRVFGQIINSMED